MKIEDFDYDLPQELVANHPCEPRDAARLLLPGPPPLDRRVRDLPDLLRPGDLLVINDTKVVPARLFGRRGSGGRVECLVLRREPGGCHEALVKAHRRLRPGESVQLDGGIEMTLLERPRADAVWRIRLTCEGDLDRALDEHGHPPLPPYIKRPDAAIDRERYQTVYATHPGSAAAPTAGLHFTPHLMERLIAAGIAIARVTLHVGYGTFQPVESIEGHRMHEEEFEVTEEAAAAIRGREGRLIAVGTTSARVLETLAREGGIRAARGRTGLFLHPGEPFLAVEGLLTNFHVPRSSLLLLVCALAGRERILAAYSHAIRERYRFFSYGDAMLIL